MQCCNCGLYKVSTYVDMPNKGHGIYAPSVKQFVTVYSWEFNCKTFGMKNAQILD